MELFIKQGDHIKKGQKIANVNFEKIKEAGYDPTTIIVITNTNEFLDVLPTQNKAVSMEDLLLNIVL